MSRFRPRIKQRNSFCNPLKQPKGHPALIAPNIEQAARMGRRFDGFSFGIKN
jgi:hypothetical protein